MARDGMTLYGIALSGPTYKVALMLSLAGQRFSYRHMNLMKGAHKQPEFLAINRYGQVPALRHRSDELAEIASSVLRSTTGARSLRLSHQVVRVLEGYSWPGNIAELEDVLRYVVARKPVGVVQPPDLPAFCFTSAPRLTMLETAQADAIIHALYETRGNRYKAAAMLGIARSSLYRKIDAFGISYVA